jgi:hypothetical protein
LLVKPFDSIYKSSNEIIIDRERRKKKVFWGFVLFFSHPSRHLFHIIFSRLKQNRLRGGKEIRKKRRLVLPCALHVNADATHHTRRRGATKNDAFRSLAVG